MYQGPDVLVKESDPRKKSCVRLCECLVGGFVFDKTPAGTLNLRVGFVAIVLFLRGEPILYVVVVERIGLLNRSSRDPA